MNRIALTIASVSLAAALSGCADLLTGGPLIRPGEPTGVIQVFNAARGPVTAVLISSCDASTYGLNRLPDGVAILPGRAWEFTVSAGCWDVDAGSSDQGEARQRMHVGPGGAVRYNVTN